MENKLPINYLIPPNLDIGCVKEKITCIRPGRSGKFKLKASVLNKKIIVHNYGAGGSGWSLLFGLVHESIRQFEELLLANPDFVGKTIHVIGAGCMGLLTAVLLSKKGYKVKITADEIENLTSHKAAGLLGYYSGDLDLNISKQKFIEKLNIDSFKNYESIYQKKHDLFKDNVKQLPIYINKNIKIEGLSSYVNLKLLSEPELVVIDFNNGKKYEVLKYVGYFIDVVSLMRQMHLLLKDNDIQINRQKINNLDEIDESIIFNCTGLGAKKLVNDNKMKPVQGHFITLQNQPKITDLNYMIFGTIDNAIRNNICFVPKEEGMIGISFYPNEYSLESNQEEFDLLLKRCIKFFIS